MGPPREHGGMLEAAGLVLAQFPLQWGRRANTAECKELDLLAYLDGQLQWGRRANTAEWTQRARRLVQWVQRFNGAAARTRRNAVLQNSNDLEELQNELREAC